MLKEDNQVSDCSNSEESIFLLKTVLEIKKDQISRSDLLLNEIKALNLTFLSEDFPTAASLVK